MNLPEQKIELIQWLSVIDDATILKKIADLKDQNTRDWWDEIPDAEKESLDEGLVQAEAGNLKPHSDARSIYEKWL